MLKNGDEVQSLRFLCSRPFYNDAKAIMAGMPMDFTCSFRPGARFGPQKIREASIGLEEYSVYQEKSIEETAFYDCGDLLLPFGNVEESLNIIYNAASEVFSDEKTPVFTGGEHLVSLPLIKSAYEKYGNKLILIHMDAHADLRDGYTGCGLSHASVIRRILDFMPGENVFQLGIRSGAKEEFDFARENTHLFKYKVAEPLEKIIPELTGKPVYLTLDIDVVDPAFACGTGTPEPCGISSSELLEAITMMNCVNLIGCDVVEVSPPFDLNGITAILAAKILRELLLIVS